jgi:glutamate-5-semialdehyde dehydrogenase
MSTKLTNSFHTVGKCTLRTKLDEGLELERVTCPIGVLLIIFEARPEVIANIASLAIKSGNAAILKGGKESTNSFVAISTVISNALTSTSVPNGAIQLVTSRSSIDPLLEQDRLIDLVIPRGSNELVQYIKAHTRIPVLGHADGLCSIYIHKSTAASPEMAINVIVDAKTGYTAACNSIETLLVDEEALTTVLPSVASALLAKGVSLRCDTASKTVLEGLLPSSSATILQDATEEDYNTEFLDLILAIKTIPTTGPVSGVDGAIAHINSHSSHHTDAILTSTTPDEATKAIAEHFLSSIDSAGVFWNTSTRFADGMRYGFGTEVGISTNKIHARGPVGLEGLTVYKYKIRGTGQGAGDYGSGGKAFLHQNMAL